MKILDRALIIVFNICLLIVSLWVSIVGVAKSSWFYNLEYKINGLTSTEVSEDYKPNYDEVVIKNKKYHVYCYLDGNRQKALFSNEQLEQMTDHIIEFLFDNQETFELKIDNVYVYNNELNEYVLTNDVSVFGEQACVHMQDVKDLFVFFQIICVIAFVIGIGSFAYLALRIRQVRHIVFEYTMFFYAMFFTFISVFFMIIFVLTLKKYSHPSMSDFLENGWAIMHVLFFPFQDGKMEGSFFNDILTEILTLNFFVTCVTIVVAFILCTQAIWLIVCLIAKIFGGQIGRKIKQKRYSSLAAFGK